MSISAVRLVGPMQPSSPGDGVLYTSPGIPDVIKQIVLANTTNAPADVAIGIGDSTVAANQIVPTVTIPANTAVAFDYFIPLGSGNTLNASQGTAGAITVTVGGIRYA